MSQSFNIAKPAIDFAIFTAIDVEREAVCEAFGLGDDDRVKKGTRVYWRGNVPLNKDGEYYEIVVAQPHDMANVDAALMVADTLRCWRPYAAIMVGIAGAATGDLELGDVVPGSDVLYYERGKITPDGVRPETKMLPADATLWASVKASPKWVEPILAVRPDAKDQRPCVVPGVIASGEKVVADIALRDSIFSRDRKIVAIEMEGYGFSRALWQSEHPVRALVIRAIADFADSSKNSEWHPYAAAAAASYAKHFIKDRPVPPQNVPRPETRDDCNDERHIGHAGEDPAQPENAVNLLPVDPREPLTEPLQQLLVSSKIPYVEPPVLPRQRLVSYLHDKFSSGQHFISLEGVIQSGKTALMAEFAKTYAARSFAFFTGTDLLNSNLRSFLTGLCEQMAFYLGRPIRGLEEPDTDKLLQIFGQLHKDVRIKASREKKPTFFVIDGVEWLTSERAVAGIMELLPAIPTSFTFLLISSTPGLQLAGEPKSVDMQPFTRPEVVEYLRDLQLPESAIDEIDKASGGWPGYLSLVRRQSKEGMPADQIVKELAPDLRGMFDKEWARANVQDEATLIALAILAFAKNPLTEADLRTIGKTSDGTVCGRLDRIAFLRKNHAGSSISFISDSHKQFVMDILKNRRDTAEALLISYYLRDPYSPASMEVLEVYLDTPKRYDKLKQLISAQYLQRRLAYTRDVDAVRQNLERMSEQAVSSCDWPSLPRYALAASMLREIIARPVAQAEVEALVALKEYSEAIEVAYQAVLPEDRLQLLAFVYSRMRIDGLAIADSVIAELEQIATDVKTDGLGNRAIEVAAALFDLRPQAALDLLERSVVKQAGSKAMDLARALLAIRLEHEEERRHTSQTTDLISSSITDKSLKDFVRTVSPRLQELTATQLISEAERIENSSWRMFAYVAWCNANGENADASAVIEKALETITGDESYGVSMKQLRELAEPLRNMNYAIAKPILERIDLVIKETSLKRPADELIRIEAILAAVEAPVDPVAGENRLLEAYLALDEIEEVDARCACLAQLLEALRTVEIADNGATKREIEKQLDLNFGILLRGIGDHLQATRRLLRILARVDHQRALSYAQQLNLEERRQNAYRDVLLAYVAHTKSGIDLTFIEEILNSIRDNDVYDDALLRLVKEIANHNILASRPEFRQYIERIGSIRSVQDACYANAHAIRALSKIGDDKEVGRLAEVLRQLLDQIDADWGRTKIRLEVATIIAKDQRAFAKNLVTEAQIVRASTPLATDTFVPMYVNSLYLAIKALPAPRSYERIAAKHSERLEWLIGQVPSVNVQCFLFAQLALRLSLRGSNDEFQEIVVTQVLPLLDRCQDEGERANLIVRISPVLYRYDLKSLIAGLDQLSGPQRNVALHRVFHTEVTNLPPDDPINNEKSRLQVGYAQARSACKVISMMTTDYTIHAAVDELVSAMIVPTSGKGEGEITCLVERSALDVATTLEKIVATNLPDLSNIQHNGFLVACKLHIARLRCAARHRSKGSENWKELADEVRAIPNVSDRCLVLSWAAEAMFRYESSLAIHLMREAEEVVKQIPNLLDRVSRFCEIARVWHHINREEEGRMILEEAMQLLRLSEDPQSRDQFSGRIIQLAHEIDPNFASSLTNLIDDPMQEHKRRLDVQALKLKKNPSHEVDRRVSKSDQQEIVAQATWDMLGEIAGGAGVLQPPNSVGRLLNGMVGADFEDVYPVVAWAIETTTQSVKREQVLVDTFEGILSALETCLLVGNTLTGIRQSGSPAFNALLPDSVKLLQVGTETDAPQSTVEKWVAANADGFLIVYDPLFNHEHLGILAHASSDAQVYVITSWRSQANLLVGDTSIVGRYEAVWNTLPASELPSVEVIVLGTESGNSPLVGRYLLTDSSGLNITSLATDFNAVGSLNVLTKEEAAEIRTQLATPLLGMPPRSFQGERLLRYVFTLQP